MPRLPRFRAGEELTAAKLNALVSEAERLGNIGTTEEIQVASDAAGINLTLNTTVYQYEWIKLTGAGVLDGSLAAYPYTRVTPTTTGGLPDWFVTAETGTAYEVNANVDVGELYVLAWRLGGSEPRFQADHCVTTP